MKAIIKKEKERADYISVPENEIRITTWEKVILLSHCFKKNTLKIDIRAGKEMMITFFGCIEDVAPDYQEKDEIWIKTVKYKAL
jgi:hypothetical protein